MTIHATQSPHGHEPGGGPDSPAATRPAWGAWPVGPGAWEIRVWSPSAATVAVALDGAVVAAAPQTGGWFTARIEADVGATYRIVVDGQALPDPASRAQAGGVHGASVLTLPRAPVPGWTGRRWEEAVVYEVHVGTFTAPGTLAAAAERLADLAALGITAVEVMPLNQFAGDRGWGYDGVLPYAIHPAYGKRDDLAAFVKAAHDLGVMVVLDVVYNHFGPEGAVLHGVAPAFFDPDRHTPWGPAIDFAQQPVRDYFVDNAAMWITEFGIDGLRLDAIHQIAEPEGRDLIADIAARLAGLPWPVHLIAEDERNLPDRRDAGTTVAQWNDDWHHAMHCLLTGEAEGYYAPFAVDPLGDLMTAMRDGHVDQGQPRSGAAHPRGAPSGHLPATAFVNANQTHDQIGNRAQGDRLIALAGPEVMRIAHALLLCAPAVPMLFMGEEAGSRAPFQFFADFDGDLGETVRKGRAAEFAAFGGFQRPVPDPLDPETLAASRPDSGLGDDAQEWRDLTAACLAFRHARVVPLLATHRFAPTGTQRLGERSLRVVWHFAAGQLEICANLGASPETPWSLPGAQLTLGIGHDAHAIACKVVPT